MTIEAILLIVWIHFFADFLLQTRTMGTLKSTSLKWLSIHVSIYTIPFLIFGWQYAIVNGVLHWITDFTSSRASSYFYKKQEMFKFWAVIGADQAVHLTCLVLTYNYFNGRIA